MCGRTRHDQDHDHVYYTCVINHTQHHHRPWLADHPSALTIRERLILPALGTFFTDHILGPERLTRLDLTPGTPPVQDRGLHTLRAQLTKLDRAQHNLIAQLEAYQPTGDDDLDTDWRTNLQKRFATISTQRRQTAARIADLQSTTHPDR
jgi:hypothetical protein